MEKSSARDTSSFLCKGRDLKKKGEMKRGGRLIWGWMFGIC